MKMLKIELEGCDGSGKTTGLKYFCEEARKLGLEVIETQEVGNKHIPTCVKLRQIVLDPASGLSGESMEMVFAAMRFENDRWLKTEVAGADMVVSDRGYFSHLAYAKHNCNIDINLEFTVPFISKHTLLPDIVIYFDVRADVALQRRIKRSEGVDAIEAKGTEYQDKVRLTYLRQLHQHKNLLDIHIIDANQSLEEVKTQLDHVLQKIVYETKTLGALDEN